MTFQEYVEEWTQFAGDPDEPFCPLPSGGYCDTPCSAVCFDCPIAMENYILAVTAGE